MATSHDCEWDYKHFGTCGILSEICRRFFKTSWAAYDIDKGKCQVYLDREVCENSLSIKEKIDHDAGVGISKTIQATSGIQWCIPDSLGVHVDARRMSCGLLIMKI